MASDKVAVVLVEGMLYYTTEIQLDRNDVILGNHYYDALFDGYGDFNVVLKEKQYISRINVNGNYSYLVTVDKLIEEEITRMKQINYNQ